MKLAKFAMVAAVAGLMASGLNVNPVQADSHGMHHGKMMVKDAWSRARTATAKVAGAFMVLHNMGKEDDRLVGAKSAISERVEVHTTEMKDGVMKMIHLHDGIEVKAGQMVALKPGGYHVMFLGLKEQLSEGKTFPVTLVFEKAGEVDIKVSVKKAGAMGSMNHGKMDHDKMDHDGMKKTN